MSGPIKVEHNGYDITYSENEDVWTCWQLDISNAALSRLKDKINKLVADANRPIEGAAAWYVPEYGWSQIQLVPLKLFDGDSVWVMEKEGKSFRRRKVALSLLVPNTPEATAAIAAWVTARKASQEASRIEREMFKAIPRLTREMVLPENKPGSETSTKAA